MGARGPRALFRLPRKCRRATTVGATLALLLLFILGMFRGWSLSSSLPQPTLQLKGFFASFIWPGSTLYSYTRNDRTGMVIADMLNAYAYCRRHGYVYGGSCKNGKARVQSQAREILTALGLSTTLKLWDECSPNATFMPRSLYSSYLMNKVWTPDFVQHMRSLIRIHETNDTLHQMLNSTKRMYIVATHVRRGDVRPCGTLPAPNCRYLPNSHYIKLLDIYLPASKRDKSRHVVYVFSESDSYEPWTSFDQSRYNIQLQLDTKLTEAWKTMIMADLFIMSRSSFSLIPAMLNAHGTIVYTPFSRLPLSHFEVAPMNVTQASEDEVERMAQTKCGFNSAANKTKCYNHKYFQYLLR